MGLKVFNSFNREKEEFIPVNPPYVGMYVCGPTVYADPHLGHARTYIVFDVIYRYLKYKGYKVRYVQNITDVGHLVDDSESGEDKIQKQARIEKLEPVEIAYKYEVSYFEDMQRLNVLKPDISCRATGHIIEMIELIKILIEKKHAYVTDLGNVYFDVKSFKEYGKLSKRNIEDAIESGRIERAPDKKNPLDFALWKKADKDHIMQWPSPWGMGYPGWHIECSTMSMKYIGETLDIHGGGLDNIFPHHECEIAQSEAATGKPFVKYFLHNNMLTVDGKKMGKSLGNFIILKELFKKVDPMVLRFYILQSHYRSPLDFTFNALEGAKHGYERLKSSIFALEKAIKNKKKSEEVKYSQLEKIKNSFISAMDDDFNTSEAIANLYELMKLSNIEINKSNPDYNLLIEIRNTTKEFMEDILGLKIEHNINQANIEDKLIEFILEMRDKYRKEKNYQESDKIRDFLLSLGITIKDEKDKTTYIR